MTRFSTIITMTNSFHNTSAHVRLRLSRDRVGYISRKTALRLRRELCGMSDCTCGGNFGERGPQLDVLCETSDRGYLVRVDKQEKAS